MLGMYVHTHWAYNHPYAARTWTLQDWDLYLAGLRSLGYDLVMLWPLLDCMPDQPNASDMAFLSKIGQVIDMAHDRFGMRFALTACPNTIGNDKAGTYNYEDRPYFICERKVNPKDAANVAMLLQGRRRQFELLRRADALVMIDSDPGGYIGSTNEEFVQLMHAQLDVFRSINPSIEMIYWMWVGWENYNKMWAATVQRKQGDPEPKLNWEIDTFHDTLEMMQASIPEPWNVFSCVSVHLEATDRLGLGSKRLYLPYGLIEGEPTFPLTNYDPPALERAFKAYSPSLYPRGVMANAQTHCLQLPHTYLFAHFARGGTLATVDLEGFAERVIPGCGKVIADAWRAIETSDSKDRRTTAVFVRNEVGKPHDPGDCAGLLLGKPDRFLIDLAMNLEVRAALDDVEAAITSKSNVKQILKQFLQIVRPYQMRIGFKDAYGGPFFTGLNQRLAVLDDNMLNAVLDQFHDWQHPWVRNGLLLRLLDAVEKYCTNGG